ARANFARRRPSRGEARAILFVVTVKSVVALAMILFAWNYAGLADIFGAYFPDALNTRHRWYTGTDTASWYLPLMNWDGQHYLLLSEYGYRHGYDRTSGQQFFPLYPLLIRACGLILPRPAAALLLNTAFMAGFALFLYRIGAAYGCRWPALAVLIMLAFPTAFYTSAFYAEPLFLFLLSGFIWHFFCTRRRVYLLYFALLPLTRGNAAFVFGGLLLAGMLDTVRARFAHRLQTQARGHLTKRERRKQRHVRETALTLTSAYAPIHWRAYAHCAAAFAFGAAAYLVFFHFAAGDAFAGLTAQRRYGHDYSVLSLFDLPHVWGNLSGARMKAVWFDSHSSRLNHLVMWLLFAAIALFVRMRAWRLLCFYFPLLYCHMAMGFLTGFSRYALTALPFLALVVAQSARRRAQAALVCALCAAAFIVQLYLAARFSVNIKVDG
ncbi:MAG: hypothetical protein OD918_01995, partial [Gammaproteobacteria bacterium]